MKVFSLQAPIYRGAWLSSRLTAQTSQLAAVRRDALERWRRARSRGLSAEEAARAVGASRASLYRWEKRPEPRSRRPRRQRQPTWTSALMRKIERLRADHPMWGKRKLAVLLRREGIDVSVSMVRRIPECDVRDAPQGSDHVREERQGTRQISLAGLSRAIRGQKGGQAAPFLRSMPPLEYTFARSYPRASQPRCPWRRRRARELQHLRHARAHCRDGEQASRAAYFSQKCLLTSAWTSAFESPRS